MHRGKNSSRIQGRSNGYRQGNTPRAKSVRKYPPKIDYERPSKVEMITNLHEVNTKSDDFLCFHYHVDYRSTNGREVKKANYREIVFKKLALYKIQSKSVAFDEMNSIFSLVEFPLGTHVDDREWRDTCDFKLTRSFPVSATRLDNDSKTVLDLFTRAAFANSDQGIQNRNLLLFTDKIQNENYLSKDSDIYILKGFLASFHQVQVGTMFMVNSVVRPSVPHTSLIDWLKRKALVGGYPSLSDAFHDKNFQFQVNKAISKMKIKTSHSKGIKFTIGGFDFRNTANNYFFNIDGQRQSIAQYFKTRYNLTLEYPDYPLAFKHTPQRGKEAAKFPIEVCTIVAGQATKPLSGFDMGNFLNLAASIPSEKMDSISSLIKRINNNYLLTENIEISPEKFKVQSDIINYPELTIRGESKDFEPLNPSKATADWNFKGLLPYRSPSSLNSDYQWCVLAPSGINLDRIIGDFVKYARLLGMDLKNPDFVKTTRSRGDTRNFADLNEWKKDVDSTFYKLKSKGKKFALVILPNDNGNATYYGAVKSLSANYNVITQCVKKSNAAKARDSLLINLAVQLNAKLGGINVAVDHNKFPKWIGKQPVLMGFDVCHASPLTDSRKQGGFRDRNKTKPPSVAAFCGVFGPFLSFPSTHIQHVEAAQEVCPDVIRRGSEIVLNDFKGRSRGGTPSSIIMFRDGVGDDQLEQVRLREIPEIKKSIAKVYPDADIPLVFIVAVKRHNFRAALKANGVIGNPPSGTVINTDILEFENDFYMWSHHGALGTSRPVYYKFLEGGNHVKNTGKEFHQFTYSLCFLHGSATKAVSLPLPLFMAHNSALIGSTMTTLRIPNELRQSYFMW